MVPGQVPSDFDLQDANADEAAGRHAILVDLYSEFQGAAGAYAALGVLLPLLGGASVLFEWTERSPEVLFLIGAVLFVAMMSIALYSLVWFLWARKRLKAVEEHMRVAWEREVPSKRLDAD